MDKSIDLRFIFLLLVVALCSCFSFRAYLVSEESEVLDSSILEYKESLQANSKNLILIDKMYPTKSGNRPEWGIPEPLDVSKFKGRTHISFEERTFKGLNIWIDFYGVVYCSYVDSPYSMTFIEDKLVWQPVEKAKSYNIYTSNYSVLNQVEEPELQLYNNVASLTLPMVSIDTTETEYLISAIDKYGLESPPVRKGYVPLDQNGIDFDVEIVASPDSVFLVGEDISWDYKLNNENVKVKEAEWAGVVENPNEVGFYKVYLRVQDISGIWSNWFEKDYPIGKRLYAPTAKIIVEPSNNITTLSKVKWAYSYEDKDNNEIIDVEWQNAQTRYTQEGIYKVKLRVKDSTGLWSEWTQKEITVTKGNNKPTATIKVNPSKNITTETILNWDLDYYDPEGDALVSVQWENKKNSYSTPGEYTVRVRVQDSNGYWSDWSSRKINVLSLANPYIIVSPEEDIYTDTKLNWSYNHPNTATISEVEWINKKETYPAGKHVVKVRFKTTNNVWSDWYSKTINVYEKINDSELDDSIIEIPIQPEETPIIPEEIVNSSDDPNVEDEQLEKPTENTPIPQEPEEVLEDTLPQLDKTKHGTLKK